MITSRRIFLKLATAALATPLLPRIAQAAAAFPAPPIWSYQIGPLQVPFQLKGAAEDGKAFHDAATDFLIWSIDSDVPAILNQCGKSDPSPFLLALRDKTAALSAMTPNQFTAPDWGKLKISNADLAADITIAATAALMRWRLSVLTMLMREIPQIAAIQPDPVSPIYSIEAAGAQVGSALHDVAFATRGDHEPKIQLWQLRFIAYYTQQFFLPLRGSQYAHRAPALELALGYPYMLNRSGAGKLLTERYETEQTRAVCAYVENELMLPYSQQAANTIIAA